MNGTLQEYFSEMMKEMKNDNNGRNSAASKNNSMEED
jgi:hypothetical protein